MKVLRCFSGGVLMTWSPFHSAISVYCMFVIVGNSVHGLGAVLVLCSCV